MAQTTGSLSWANCKIELSKDAGVSWKDISGFTNSIAVDGGERATAEFFTALGDIPIVTAGKRGLIEITAKCVYTEDAADAPFIMVHEGSEAQTPLMIRWSPKGGLSGNFRFTSSAGQCVKPVYPQGAADSADAIPVEFTIKCGSITKSVITP
jgi:hypothetical protein